MEFKIIKGTTKELEVQLNKFMFFETHMLLNRSENHQKTYPRLSQKDDPETGVGAFGRSWETFGAPAPFLIAKHAVKGCTK